MWRFLRNTLYPLGSKLVLLTEDDAKNYNFVQNKVVIPNFINIQEKNSNLRKENTILAVGRLHPVKQFDKLIDLYLQIDTDYKLYIVGEGNERQKLEQKIKNLNLENKVFLVGQVKNIYDYYKKAKIFVLTSKHEAFPNVILEAMYFGCVVVSLDCPYGPRAIIENEKSGFLVQNDEEFIEKLKFILKNEKEQLKISKNAIDRSNGFTHNKIIKKWEELIENIKI